MVAETCAFSEIRFCIMHNNDTQTYLELPLAVSVHSIWMNNLIDIHYMKVGHFIGEHWQNNIQAFVSSCLSTSVSCYLYLSLSLSWVMSHRQHRCYTPTQWCEYSYSHIIIAVLAEKIFHAPTPTCLTACCLCCGMCVLIYCLCLPLPSSIWTNEAWHICDIFSFSKRRHNTYSSLYKSR